SSPVGQTFYGLPHPRWGGYDEGVSKPNEHQRRVLTRLRTARGHLDGVIRMVEAGAYCPDVMKQLSAVQGLLEGTSRGVLRNHLETCVAQAMREGRVEEIVDELMEALKYDKWALRPAPADDELGAAVGGET
ncbi:MAG: metal-sensitive transcriptional regulator, partial [Actinomycetota bacterium]|nr:metal-sensitive transcriptional regulator [Actinomycetota bacterium]